MAIETRRIAPTEVEIWDTEVGYEIVHASVRMQAAGDWEVAVVRRGVVEPIGEWTTAEEAMAEAAKALNDGRAELDEAIEGLRG